MFKSKFVTLALTLFFIIGFKVFAQEQETVIVRRFETDEVLNNPGKGFNTFQCFNGDYGPQSESGIKEDGGRFVPDCYSEPVTYKFDESLNNLDHPQSSIAYFRINWSFIEPEEGVYNWAFIDSLLATGYERKQHLLLRIAPFSGYANNEHKKDVPYWFRKKTGLIDPNTSPWIFFDQNNPLYLNHFGNMIREFGKRYDGHPLIEAVDLAIAGQAGEGAGSSLLKEEIRKGLVKAYTDSFKKTHLIVLGRTDKTEENVYQLATQEGVDVGWRIDCFGDMRETGFMHMFNYYPWAINKYMQAQNAWEKAPVTFEACWTMMHWKEQGWDINDIINQSLKWHMSSFNNKSSFVPEEWKPAVDRWIKKWGIDLFFVSLPTQKLYTQTLKYHLHLGGKIQELPLFIKNIH